MHAWPSNLWSAHCSAGCDYASFLFPALFSDTYTCCRCIPAIAKWEPQRVQKKRFFFLLKKCKKKKNLDISKYRSAVPLKGPECASETLVNLPCDTGEMRFGPVRAGRYWMESCTLLPWQLPWACAASCEQTPPGGKPGRGGQGSGAPGRPGQAMERKRSPRRLDRGPGYSRSACLPARASRWAAGSMGVGGADASLRFRGALGFIPPAYGPGWSPDSSGSVCLLSVVRAQLLFLSRPVLLWLFRELCFE